MATVAAPRPLTRRQSQAYRFIFDYTCEHGYQPSYREVMAEFGWLTTNALGTHMRQIADRGWCELPDGESRAARFLYCPDGRPFRGFEPK